jgi:membrane-associated phospholipid phosphatase
MRNTRRGEKESRQAIRSLELVDCAFFLYLTVTFVLLVCFGSQTRDTGWHIGIHLAFFAMAVILLSVNTRHPGRFVFFSRVWYIPFLYVFLFEEIGNMIHLIQPMFFDSWVLELESRVFGGYPTVWLQGLATPWLTELMSFFYMTYYFLIPGLGLNLYAHRAWSQLNDLILTTSIIFFFCFLHYLLMPVLGPIFQPEGLPFELVSLRGGPVTAFEQWLFFKGAIRGGAFPSSHVAIAVAVLYFSVRAKRYPRVFLFMVTGLAISTVYNGYHYGVDVVYGVVTGLTFSLVCPYLNILWRQVRIFPQVFGEKAWCRPDRNTSCSRNRGDESV